MNTTLFPALLSVLLVLSSLPAAAASNITAAARSVTADTNGNVTWPTVLQTTNLVVTNLTARTANIATQTVDRATITNLTLGTPTVIPVVNGGTGNQTGDAGSVDGVHISTMTPSRFQVACSALLLTNSIITEANGNIGFNVDIPLERIHSDGNIALGVQRDAALAAKTYRVYTPTNTVSTSSGVGNYYGSDLELVAGGWEGGLYCYPPTSVPVGKAGDIVIRAGNAEETANNGAGAGTYIGGDVRIYSGYAKQGDVGTAGPTITQGKIRFYTPTAASRVDNSETESMTIESAGVFVGGTFSANNSYISNNCSALTFTDRSDAPTNASEAVRMIASYAVKDGKVDHSKLDPGLWGTTVIIVDTGAKVTNVVSEVRGTNNMVLTPAKTNVVSVTKTVLVPDQSKRNLSMSVSALMDVNQQLLKQMNALIARTAALEAKTSVTNAAPAGK